MIKEEHKLLYNGYIQSTYEYKGFKIWRTHSSQNFRLEKDNKLYTFIDFHNPNNWEKISLKNIKILIDENRITEFYKIEELCPICCRVKNCCICQEVEK